MKYYAVRKGRKTGIFITWADCQQQVIGYSGAEYKSFPSEAEAKDYLGGASGTPEKVQKEVVKDFSEEELTRIIQDMNKVTAFVDGSFDKTQGMYSYGLVALGIGETYTDSCYDFEPLHVELRNVAGELLGSMQAMKYCIEKGIKELDLYYDYYGIEMWATGRWKCNKVGTKEYKAYYDSIKDKLTVTFHKVPAHTGIKYNEMADKLAKEALGIT